MEQLTASVDSAAAFLDALGEVIDAGGTVADLLKVDDETSHRQTLADYGVDFDGDDLNYIDAAELLNLAVLDVYGLIRSDGYGWQTLELTFGIGGPTITGTVYPSGRYKVVGTWGSSLEVSHESAITEAAADVLADLIVGETP